MYEVETKVEVSKAERDRLVALFKERGYVDHGVTLQHNVYVRSATAERVRYRNDGGKYYRNVKHKEVISGQVVRREDEHEITKGEFDTAVAAAQDAVVINKEREWFEASYGGISLVVTIDAVTFAHSPSVRYFIEAEIAVASASEVDAARRAIRAFLTDILGADYTEAPSMYKMASERL